MQGLGLKPVERLREEMASAEGRPEVGSVRVPFGSAIDGASHSSEDANDGADGHSVDSEGDGRCAKTPMS
jgi:hypothetical protein